MHLYIKHIIRQIAICKKRSLKAPPHCCTPPCRVKTAGYKTSWVGYLFKGYPTSLVFTHHLHLKQLIFEILGNKMAN